MAATSSALAGINNAESRLNSAAFALSGGSVGVEGAAGIDTVNLSGAIVDMIQARNGAAASVKVARVEQDVEKSVLNLLA